MGKCRRGRFGNRAIGDDPYSTDTAIKVTDAFRLQKRQATLVASLVNYRGSHIICRIRGRCQKHNSSRC